MPRPAVRLVACGAILFVACHEGGKPLLREEMAAGESLVHGALVEGMGVDPLPDAAVVKDEAMACCLAFARSAVQSGL
jgi:hypothetical protein